MAHASKAASQSQKSSSETSSPPRFRFLLPLVIPRRQTRAPGGCEGVHQAVEGIGREKVREAGGDALHGGHGSSPVEVIPGKGQEETSRSMRNPTHQP